MISEGEICWLVEFWKSALASMPFTQHTYHNDDLSDYTAFGVSSSVVVPTLIGSVSLELLRTGQHVLTRRGLTEVHVRIPTVHRMANGAMCDDSTALLSPCDLDDFPFSTDARTPHPGRRVYDESDPVFGCDDTTLLTG